jgi:hypothetical protein
MAPGLLLIRAMPDPNDPDIEDRRPDRDREREIFDEQEDPYDLEDDTLDEEVVSSRQLGLFDDDDMLDYSNDDLKDMDGPDS